MANLTGVLSIDEQFTEVMERLNIQSLVWDSDVEVEQIELNKKMLVWAVQIIDLFYALNEQKNKAYCSNCGEEMDGEEDLKMCSNCDPEWLQDK